MPPVRTVDVQSVVASEPDSVEPVLIAVVDDEHGGGGVPPQELGRSVAATWLVPSLPDAE
jgi:hypothetical protein